MLTFKTVGTEKGGGSGLPLHDSSDANNARKRHVTGESRRERERERERERGREGGRERERGSRSKSQGFQAPRGQRYITLQTSIWGDDSTR